MWTCVISVQNPICCSPHLPAKALLLNIKQYNGKFGCSTCKHPGRYSHSDWQIRARLYEYWPSGTVAVRTAHKTRMFGRIGEARGTTVFGIKRENVFRQLVDISDNLPIDWMHCVCKGILKRQLFKWWFNPQYATNSNSLLGISHELENMFLCIKVPHDFTRKPWSIAELKQWKVSEFEFFALFARLPCLRYTVHSWHRIWHRPLLSLCTSFHCS